MCVSLQFRLVVKTALKLLLVFVEYTEANAALLIQAVNGVDTKRGKADCRGKNTPTSEGVSTPHCWMAYTYISVANLGFVFSDMR